MLANKPEEPSLKEDFIERCYEVGGKDFVEAIAKYGYNERGEKLRLLPWYSEYAELVGDLRISWVCVSGSSQIGKAQPLDAKVLTPDGWKLMGDISPGDKVICPDGSTAVVSQIFPQGEKDVYKVILDDGTETECCDDHLWLTQTARDRAVNRTESTLKPRGKRQRDWTPLPDGTRPGTVKSLREIRETLLVTDKNGNPQKTRGVSTKSNHNLPAIAPIDFEYKDIGFDYYLLGALIGNGCLRNGNILFSSGDAETLENVRQCLPNGYSLTKRMGSKVDYGVTRDIPRTAKKSVLRKALEKLGLTEKYSYEKFIPEICKFSDLKSRVALLQGMMDTDGYASNSGILQYNTSSFRLAEDFRELVLSLGGVVGKIGVKQPKYTYNGEKKLGRESYTLTFRVPDGITPFRLTRKLERCVDRSIRNHRRYIRDVIYVGKKQCQCLLIDHPSHLYITDNYIPTHNTLCNTLLLCYCLTEGLSAVWAYDQQNSRDIQVNANFRPVIRHWLKAKGIEVKRSQGSQNNSLFQVKGAEAQFMYVSTSKKTDGNEGAAAGSNVVGVSRDILFKEERSQYPPGAGDPLNRRLDAGKLPSRPHREVGTPGSGNGIEAEIETADYKFYPHYTCPSCGKTAPLHPKGCLLKPKDGRYLSLSGRPIDWHQKNGEAYFGCSHCGAEIPQEVRENALFRCLKTGISLRDFLDSLPKGTPAKRIKAGIILSPLLRIRQTNAAEEIIQEGLTTFNTDDWQQQGLGEPSESNFTGVTLDMLKAAIKRSPPQGKPHFTLCGIDQGRAEYWLVKCAYYLPDNWTELPFAQVIERSRRVIAFGGDITKGEVSDRISDCAFGIIDNEPDISAAIALSGETCLELGDQQSSMLDAVREGVVREGGNEHPCWKFRNEKFLKSVLTAFLMEMYSLPPEWEQWLGMKTERSPLVHLAAPSYNPATGKWKRPKNHVDDLYYAAMFCEVGFYVYLSRYYSGADVFEVGEERDIFEAVSKF